MSGNLAFTLVLSLITGFSTVSSAQTTDLEWDMVTSGVQSTLKDLQSPTLTNFQRKEALLAQKTSLGHLYNRIIMAPSGGENEALADWSIDGLVALSKVEINEQGKGTLISCGKVRSGLAARSLTSYDKESLDNLSYLEKNLNKVLNLLCGK